MSDVTELLQAIDKGNEAATAELLPIVYNELRQLARAKLAGEPLGQTIQATALVHEAYLRLVGDNSSKSWNGKHHFFGAAAEAMRRILIENARRKRSARRGGDRHRIELNSQFAIDDDRDQRLVELSDAIDKLEAIDPRKADLVKLKLFAGLSIEEAAAALGIAVATAYRLWDYCRAWLKLELG